MSALLRKLQLLARRDEAILSGRLAAEVERREILLEGLIDMGATISVGDAAGVRKKESPALAPKARSRGRPSFYAVTTSSRSNAPTVSLKLEAGAAPIRLTAILALNRLHCLW